jgi:hypothetical protein
MRHLSVENLLTYIEGRTPAVEKADFDQHLAACDECAELRREFQGLTSHLQEDSACEPPAELVLWGVELFQPVMQPASQGKIRKIIAALVFDTFDQPAMAGLRRVGAPPRQLLLVGEFSFDEVPKDTYHLSVDLPEGQITLFCVHRAKA